MADTRENETDDEADWGAGSYELVLELGDRNDGHLQAALDAVRLAAHVDGSWARAGSHHEPVPPTLASLFTHGSLYGSVVLPSGHRVGCGLLAIRDDGRGTVYTASMRGGKVHIKHRYTRPLGRPRDWLDLYIPLGTLAKLDPRVGFFPHILPGEDPREKLQWRRPIDDWLADIGSRTFETTPFRIGVIGGEVGFDIDSDQLRQGIPKDHGFAYLWPEHGNLVYYPATF
jgi:hypothetical protein